MITKQKIDALLKENSGHCCDDKKYKGICVKVVAIANVFNVHLLRSCLIKSSMSLAA